MTINSNFQLPTTISGNEILPTYEFFRAIFFETPQYPSSKNFNLFDPLQTVCPFHHLIWGVCSYSSPFPHLFFPLPPSPPSQFFWIRSKGQNDNRKKTTISDRTPGMALVVNLSCGSYSQAKCDDFNATTCLPDVRWTKNVNFQEKRPIKQKWFITSGWIWDISKLHG